MYLQSSWFVYNSPILLHWNGWEQHWPILGSLMFQTFEAGPGSLWITTGGHCCGMEGGIVESGLESCNWIQNGFPPDFIQFIRRLLITKGKSESEWNAPLRKVVFKDKMKDVLNNCGSVKLNVIKKMELICSDPISIPAWNKKGSLDSCFFNCLQCRLIRFSYM